MGEYVWTTYLVGGEIKTPATVEKLLRFTEGFEERLDRSGLMDIVVAKTAATFSGSLNYGVFEDFDALLREEGLSYTASWSAQSGAFDSGLRFWRPGMAQPQSRAADDDGRPMIGLTDLVSAAKDGRSLDHVIAYLETAVDVPPLTAAAGAFDDVGRRSIAERLGYASILKVEEISRDDDFVTIVLGPARRGYFVAIHTNADKPGGHSIRRDFGDIIEAAAVFDRVRQNRGAVEEGGRR